MGSPGRRRLLLGITSLGTLAALRGFERSALAAPSTFPIAFQVADDNGVPVRDHAWLTAELREVTRLYGPLGLAFRVTRERRLALPLVHLETRADRDALAPVCEPHVINVFVVGSLRDVDDGITARRGVHWRTSRDASERYLIVSSIAGETVLAHELGHYFELQHSPVEDNVMSYARTGGPVFFDAHQAEIVRAAASRLARSGEVPRDGA